MVTRKRTPETPPVMAAPAAENEEMQRFLEEDENMPGDIALANLLADMGATSNANVRIYKQGAGGTRDMILLTECQPEEFSAMRIQEEYGGGTYRIHVRAEGRIIANREMKIAPPARTTGAAPPVDHLAPMQQTIAQLGDMVRQLAETVRAGQQQPQSRTDMLNEMLVMKELLGTTPAAKVVDPMESLERILAVHTRLSDITGGGSPEKISDKSILMSAIENFGGPLMAIMAQKAAAAAAAAPAPGQTTQMQAAPALGHIEPAPREQAPQHNEENEKMKMAFQYYLGLLAQKAESDADPALYADLIIDNLDKNSLNELLGPDTWFDNLCALNVKTSQYREWFSELRDLILQALTEDAAPGEGSGLPKPNEPENQHASGGPANANTARPT